MLERALLLLALGQDAVEFGPDAGLAVPGATGGGLGVFGGAGFEEVGVLDARQQALQPGQGVFAPAAAVDLRQAQLAQAPVGDEADVRP